MRSMGVVLALALLLTALAGCTDSSRDIESEAKKREDWAREHNDYDPVAVLSGPERIQPGALVWFSAHGSHDPDFFGAHDEARKEARQQGGFHAENDAGSVQWEWALHLDGSRNKGLGNGIREYQWQIDDGPVLVAHELTHRYGSEDGPVRFPVGFTEEGTHTIVLRVVDWNGETDEVRQTLEVHPDGADSSISGWRTTEEGWTHDRTVQVAPDHYGCLMPGRNHYDAQQHRFSVPWDLYFFAEGLTLEASWARLEAPEARPATPETDLVPLGAAPVATDAGPGLNLNDLAVTLGHCEEGDVWEAFDSDQGPIDDAVERGEVGGEDLAQHAEKTGAKTERRADWNIDVHLSDRGDMRGGTGGDVDLRLTFVPAKDTRYGGL